MNGVIQVWVNHLQTPKISMTHNNEKTKKGSFWLEHFEERIGVLNGVGEKGKDQKLEVLKGHNANITVLSNTRKSLNYLHRT